MSRFRFGLGPAGLPWVRQRADADKFVDFCRRAEDLGVYSLGFGDHLDDRPSPIAAIAAAAAHTSTIKVGVLVLCNELRNRAVLAQEARTLQVLSGCRVEFGLGVGWMARDFDRSGTPQRPFAERLVRLEQSVESIRAAFAADLDVACPPLVIGGGGPRMLRAAARLADIVTINIPLLSGVDVASNRITAIGEEDVVAARLRLVREINADVEIQMNTHEVFIGEDWRAFADRRARELDMSVDALLASPHVLVGSVARVIDVLHERAERYGVTYWSMTGAALESIATVIARM